MDPLQAKKIERYLNNSKEFIWGFVLGNNQKERYDSLEVWLIGNNFSDEVVARVVRGREQSYSYVTRQLIDARDIEFILFKLVGPEVEMRFPSEALGFLRRCWVSGALPNASMLRPYDDDVNKSWFPFLEIHKHYGYVDRWGEFAGLWFEDIEPNIERKAEEVELTEEDVFRRFLRWVQEYKIHHPDWVQATRKA